MRKVAMMVAGAVLLGLAGSASAQTMCRVQGGSADIYPGIPATATPLAPAQGLRYKFKGALANCSAPGFTTVCSTGVFGGAACQNNSHTGSAVVCSTGCDFVCKTPGPGGPQDCDSADPNNLKPRCTGTAKTYGTLGGANGFSGQCVGTNCSGKDTNNTFGYTLLFDRATVEAALAECDAAPGRLERATFDGGLMFR